MVRLVSTSAAKVLFSVGVGSVCLIYFSSGEYCWSWTRSLARGAVLVGATILARRLAQGATGGLGEGTGGPWLVLGAVTSDLPPSRLVALCIGAVSIGYALFSVLALVPKSRPATKFAPPIDNSTAGDAPEDEKPDREGSAADDTSPKD